MDNETPSNKNLIAALVKAQAAVEAVAKASRNEFHRYNYASADDVIAGARKALDENGLAVFQAGWRIEGEAAIIDYEVQHVSGETAHYATTVPLIVEKGRPLDKALFGALTEGLSYFLRGLLLIPREDTDRDTPSARDDRDHEPPARAPRPASATKDELAAFGGAVKVLLPDATDKTRKDFAVAAAQSLGIDLGKATGAELNKVLDKLTETIGKLEEGAE